MGARRGGGARGAFLPPMEFKKMTSHATVLQNILNVWLVPTAIAPNTLYVSLKRRKNAKHFVCAFGLFFVRRAQNVSTFQSVGDFAHLSKNFCGRPCSVR